MLGVCGRQHQPALRRRSLDQPHRFEGEPVLPTTVVITPEYLRSSDEPESKERLTISFLSARPSFGPGFLFYVLYRTDSARVAAVNYRPNRKDGNPMIADRFDSRTVTRMEIALERACSGLTGQDHAARCHVAKQILKCARKGNVTLGAMAEAGQIAASELSPTHGGLRAGDIGRPCE